MYVNEDNGVLTMEMVLNKRDGIGWDEEVGIGASGAPRTPNKRHRSERPRVVPRIDNIPLELIDKPLGEVIK